jgi:flagellar biosynthesis/type III secretory pathway protein FliH
MRDLITELEDEAIRRGLARGLELGLKQGIEQGIQQGVEQGIQQGIQQGHHEGQIDMLLAVLSARFGSSLGEVVPTIRGLPDDVLRTKVVPYVLQASSIDDIIKFIKGLGGES